MMRLHSVECKCGDRSVCIPFFFKEKRRVKCKHEEFYTDFGTEKLHNIGQSSIFHWFVVTEQPAAFRASEEKVVPGSHIGIFNDSFELRFFRA